MWDLLLGHQLDLHSEHYLGLHLELHLEPHLEPHLVLHWVLHWEPDLELHLVQQLDHQLGICWGVQLVKSLAPVIQLDLD